MIYIVIISGRCTTAEASGLNHPGLKLVSNTRPLRNIPIETLRTLFLRITNFELGKVDLKNIRENSREGKSSRCLIRISRGE